MRSKELYKKSGTILTCILSEELGKIVQMLNQLGDLRNSILWENIFTELIIDIYKIQKEISRIKKDNIY